jgi:hypothetical protein
VTSRTTKRFRDALARLPEAVRRQAREAYRLFADNPDHPSLHFKSVHTTRPIFSARVSIQYRALCVREGDQFVWFWIGTHAEYDQLLGQL